MTHTPWSTRRNLRFGSRSPLLALLAAMLLGTLAVALPGRPATAAAHAVAPDSAPGGAASPVAKAAADKGPIGWDTYRHLDRLPDLSPGTRTGQFSSFDRAGGNNDGFDGTYSCLRTTTSGCVIAENDGAGEISSIWFTRDGGDVTATGTITIELDGRTVLDAPLQDVVDGEQGAPFVYPLVANADQSSGGVYIKVPMPYRQSMRVTVQHDPDFYHVSYRQFTDAEGVSTFDPSDRATDVIDMLKASGTEDPKPAEAGSTIQSATLDLARGQQAQAATVNGGAGDISALRVRVPDGEDTNEVLAGLRLHLSFDGHETADAPIGQFFGSGLGESPVHALLFAMDTSANGWYTTWWPMPFRDSAQVSLENTTGQALSGLDVQVTSARNGQWADALGPDGNAGYFTAESHEGETVQDHDWVFADRTGRGKFVGVTNAMQGHVAAGNTREYLEGDERVYTDGQHSPQMHGTGTEDFYESGWYFNRGTYSNPMNGEPVHHLNSGGCEHECDDAYRLMLGDAVPYDSQLRFGMEHGPQDNISAHYGSTAFLYAKPSDRVGLHHTAVVDTGDAASRAAAAYTEHGAADQHALTSVHEGDDDDQQMTDDVRATSAPVSFRLDLDQGNQGVLLRRTSDQARGYQSAAVLVDGTQVGTWTQPLANADQRWLSDSFALPAGATAGKSAVTVELRPQPGSPAWTASRYTADSLTPGGYTDSSAPRSAGGVTLTGHVHGLHLTWPEPSDDVGVRAYRVYGSTGSNVSVSDADLLATVTGTGFAHGPLQIGQTWHYRVVAVDVAGHTTGLGGVVSGHVATPTRSDVNGDGRDDVVDFTRGDSARAITAFSTGRAFQGAGGAQAPLAAGDAVPLTGDFDGDGKDDAVTFARGASGDVSVALSDGSGFGAGARWLDGFATGDEIPAVGDFDGDGKDDIAAFTRGDAADAFVALSTGSSFGPAGKWHDHFAVGSEVPEVGDFDGDGRDDIVTFTRGTSALAFVALSNGSRFQQDGWLWHPHFAVGSELPAVGDFDGDGRDDIATFTRGGAADVYVALSDGSGFRGDGVKWHDDFAAGSQVPGVGDFDGDGRSDLVSYTLDDAADVLVAPSDGTSFAPNPAKWHDSFGSAGDWPVPSEVEFAD